MLENIKMIAVKSIQGHSEGNAAYLEIKVAIANTNAEPVKLRKRELEFFLGTMTRDETDRESKERGERLGLDKVTEEILLEPEEVIGGKDPEGVNAVTFRVDLGTNEADVCKIMAHILNCLGNPAEKAPLLFISGKAQIGLYSSVHRGWNFWPGRIEWELTPQIQPRFLLYYGYSK